MGKKAQHEIAGFVLIVLIVSVIGVVFLSIAFAKEGVSKHTSLEVSNILEASMYFTSDCAINYPDYSDIRDLIKECYKIEAGNYRPCSDGRDVCNVLESNLKDVISKSLDVGEGSVNKAYKLDVYLLVSESKEASQEILSFSEGIFSNCSEIVGGQSLVEVSSFGFEKIVSELNVCKAKF